MGSGLRFGFGLPGTSPSRSCENTMKLCMNCHRTTPGKPMFCSFCGASYNIRICPHKHINPRSVQVCSECGSRDLSQPQPKVPLLLRPLLGLLSISPGVLLLFALSAATVWFVGRFIANPFGLLAPMCLIFLLGALLLFWMLLPDFLKRFLKRLLTPSSKGREGKRH